MSCGTLEAFISFILKSFVSKKEEEREQTLKLQVE